MKTPTVILQKIKKTLMSSLVIGAVSLILVVGVIYAWTEPGQAPPGGNVSAPLNVGSIGQSKSGGLILNTGGADIGLIVDKGNVGIGTTAAPTAKLQIVGPPSPSSGSTENPLQAIGLGAANTNSGDYNMGYKFTPNTNGTITRLGLRCNSGARTVRLYNMSGTVLASASVTAAGVSAWAYTDITPVSVIANTSYVVAVRSGSRKYCYNSSATTLVTSGNVTINDSRYGAASDAMPTAIDTLGLMYGQADVTFKKADPVNAGLALDVAGAVEVNGGDLDVPDLIRDDCSWTGWTCLFGGLTCDEGYFMAGLRIAKDSEGNSCNSGDSKENTKQLYCCKL